MMLTSTIARTFLGVLILCACAETSFAQLPESTRGPYPTYQELTQELQRIADSAPELVSISALAETPEGRSVWLAEVAARRDERPLSRRPAFIANGTHHAAELAGTVQSLRLLEHLVDQYGKDERVTRLLDEQVFYIVPRVAVDGAEHVLATMHHVRSKFVDIPQRNVSRPEDLDGDGMILTMRWQDPDGDMRVSDDDSRLLVERQPGDEGPFYRETTEGLIHEWDGETVRRSRMRVDFNRTYPFAWQPFYSFLGHQRYPLAEVETRALAEFVLSHPNIIHGHDYHTGSPVVWYPGTFFDGTEEYEEDDRLHQRIGGYGSEVTGYQYYPGYAPSHAQIPGFYTYWLYEHLGIVAFTVELGVLRNYIDIPEGATYAERDREDLTLLTWQDDHPNRDLFFDWTPFDHPQLGRVEIGGWNMALRSNAPPEELANINRRVIDFALHQASFAPKLDLQNERVERLADGLYKLAVVVRNAGTLATSGTRLGADTHPRSEPLVTVDGGGTFVVGNAVTEIPHLPAGGGRPMEWVVRTTAPSVTVTVQSSRGLYDRIAVPLR